MSTNQQLGTIAPKPTVGIEQIDMLNNCIEELGCAVDRLGSRLQTVSRPELPAPPTERGGAVRTTELPPFLQQIKNASCKIKELEIRLRTMIDCLEV